jgi:hypothetical protein
VIVTVGLCGVLGVVIGLIERNEIKGMLWFFLGCIFCISTFAKVIPIYQNRYVEFKDSFVTFHCCFAKRKSNEETITAAYKNIVKIHFQRFLLPKTYNLLITTSNYPYTISVSCFFENRKVLQRTLVQRVISENPNVMITGIKKTTLNEMLQQ